MLVEGKQGRPQVVEHDSVLRRLAALVQWCFCRGEQGLGVSRLKGAGPSCSVSPLRSGSIQSLYWKFDRAEGELFVVLCALRPEEGMSRQTPTSVCVWCII